MPDSYPPDPDFWDSGGRGRGSDGPEPPGPEFGDPEFGDPEFRDPRFPDPQFDEPLPGGNDFGEPSLRDAEFGQPSFRDAEFGQPPFRDAEFGQPPFDGQEFGDPQPGSSEFGSPQFRAPESRSSGPAGPVPSGPGHRAASHRPASHRASSHRASRPRGPRRLGIVAAAVAVVLAIAVGGWYLTSGRTKAPGGASAGQAATAAASGRAASVGAVGAPTPSAAPSATGAGTGGMVSIDWVGDMTFGTFNSWPPDGTGSLLAKVTDDLHSDLTMGNLESVLGDEPLTKCGADEANCYQFEAPTSTAAALKKDDFGAVNVANNHTMDGGSAGETSTDAALKAAGLDYAGRPGQITYLTRNGITIALLGFAPWSYDADALDIPAAEALVRQAKAHAQLVIVMEHLGAEGSTAQHVTDTEETYLGEDRGNSVAFTHGVIDAGADLVVGSGPHVLRGFQWYKGHLIAYSLGNFTGYNTLGIGPVTGISAILHVTLTAQGQFVKGSITPLKLSAPGIPAPDPAGAAITSINSLSQSDFSGNGAVHLSADGTIPAPSG